MRLGVIAFCLVLAGCEAKPTDSQLLIEPPKVETRSPAPAVATETPSPIEPERVWVASGPAQKTIPDAFQGRWDATPESCLEKSVAELKVTKNSLIFWEEGMAVTSVIPVGPDAYQVNGNAHAEDQTFEARNILVLSNDGKTLTVNPGPNSIPRVRCLTPDFPGHEDQ